MTKEQRRAKQAFARVERVPAAMKNEYGQYCHKLPVLVHQAGLAQALCFVQQKSQGGGSRLLEDLASHLHGEGLLTGRNWNSLRQRIEEAPLTEYRFLTRETMAVLLWYKRYAASVLGIEQGEEIDAHTP